MEGHLMQQKRKGYIMQQDHLMTDGSLRHLLHLHLALLLPLLRLYPPLQREQGAGVFPFALNNLICHLLMKALTLRVSEPFMYCGSPNLPQTRKSSLKLNNTEDNGHIADGAQLAKQMGKRLLLAPSSRCRGDTT
jgi:hypothetical protein